MVKPNSSRKYFLPDSYTNVPAVSCKTDSLTGSEYVPPHECISVLNEGKAGEEMWIKHSLQVLTQNEPVTMEQSVTWAVFHASLSPVDPPVLNSLLLLFSIRECASTLYVGLARAVSPTNTNFRLTFLLTRLQEALYEDLAV